MSDLIVDFEEYDSLNELDSESIDLVKEAEDALSLSYSPYSGFTVGAAAILDDGQIVKGANQENATYPAGLCAERVVLFQIGVIAPKSVIKKLAVVAKKSGDTVFKGAGPCGFCRQVMLEFEQKQKELIEIIFLGNNNKWVKTKSAVTLLPFAFGKDNLS